MSGIKGWFNIRKSIDVLDQQIKNKNHMISTTEKAFDKTQQPFMIEALKKLGLDRYFYHLVKASMKNL